MSVRAHPSRPAYAARRRSPRSDAGIPSPDAPSGRPASAARGRRDACRSVDAGSRSPARGRLASCSPCRSHQASNHLRRDIVAKNGAGGVQSPHAEQKSQANGYSYGTAMKIFIGQINPTVGALHSNAELIRRTYEEGVHAGADVVMVPELAVTGYPPRDLLDREVFVNAALGVRDALAAMTGRTTLIFGCITRNGASCGKPLHNSAIVAQNGKIVFEQHKSLLPTYDVFDELRYFEPANGVKTVNLSGSAVGVSICEDFWFDDKVLGINVYCDNPVDQLARQDARILLNISASPFNSGKRRVRYDLFSEIAKRYHTPLVYVNQVGGNDELLFDGSSIVIDAQGRTVFCAPSFEEHRSLVNLSGTPCDSVMDIDDAEEI